MTFEHATSAFGIQSPEAATWQNVPADGNCFWHVCAKRWNLEWSQIKTAAFQHLKQPAVQDLYPSVKMDEYISAKGEQGAYADEIAVMACALAMRARIAILDIDQDSIYSVAASAHTRRVVMQLKAEHYQMLDKTQEQAYIDQIDSASLDWSPMHKKRKLSHHEAGKDQGPAKRLSALGLKGGGLSISGQYYKVYHHGYLAHPDTYCRPDEEGPAADSPHEGADNCSLTVYNAHGLRAKLGAVLSHPADLPVVTETLVPDSALKDLDASLLEQGWRAIHSPAAKAGVTIMARAGYALQKVPLPQELHRWEQQGRLAAVRVIGPNHQLVAVVAAVYVVTNYGAYQQIRDEVNDMWHNVAKWIVSCGDIPLILAGDFNAPWTMVEVLDQLVHTGRLIDVHQALEAEPRAPTFKSGSVIDHVLISPAMQRLATSARTSRDPWPDDHHELSCCFQLAQSDILDWPRLQVPRPFPKAASLPVEAELDGEPAFRTTFAELLRQHRLQDALNLWSDYWEGVLLARSTAHGQPLDLCFQGRASSPLQSQKQHNSSSPGLPDNKAKQLTNLRKDLEAHARLLQEDHSPPDDVARDLCRRCALCEITLDNPHSIADVDQSIYAVQLAYDDHNAKLTKARWSTWRATFTRSEDPHASKAFRYVRGALYTPTWAVDTDHGLTASVKQMDQALRHAWIKLSQPTHMTPEAAERAFAALTPAPSGPNKLCLPELDPKEVHYQCSKLKKGKAIGIAGWHVQDLKVLPHLAFVSLTDLYNQCEETASLPDEWTYAIVSYLPKDTKTFVRPEKMRPISVLPLLLRLYLAREAPSSQFSSLTE